MSLAPGDFLSRPAVSSHHTHSIPEGPRASSLLHICDRMAGTQLPPEQQPARL